MHYYLFRILDDTPLEEAQLDLLKKGLKDIYIIEDDANGEVLIGGHCTKAIQSKKAILVEKKSAKVNWEEQWELFAENFSEGKAHIDLSPFGAKKTLLLLPGPGFGDLSHPTTYLMLEMMQKYMQKERVIDIGTGSGILALAALYLGAKQVHGIDIDPSAIKHAKQNAKLNDLKATFSKTLPKKWPSKAIFLMNMIFPEQQEFNPQRLNPHAKLWIVSGILDKQKRAYLTQAKKWGWELVSEHKRGEWMGFVFSLNEKKSKNNCWE